MIKVVIISVVIIIYLVYLLYFKHYFRVRKVFHTLKSFLDTRDSLLIKLMPGMSNQKMTNEIVKLIEERKLNFHSGYNHAILSDVKLNAALKGFYQELQKTKSNEMITQIYENLKSLENTLKKIRMQYNLEVEAYNQNLLKHKTVCLKLVRMKPLDEYQKITTKEG